ncbi:sensory box histidine kinase/response regulator [Legionella quinlivanii]|uniref:histidine kinase n=1 Tax=Legionella quinlivanii TaxID=45073 RepID=A0A0W0XZY8_9GAMM|nr:MHYT domain-containing protein [Legionella quinlivanii]KTD50032.1 sensory box histidine kinase/response regulator [Legionella quinlivanii]SEF94034.1 PAS domain S-box-containing protein [Legionella quinlivanii DSM 21216]STY11192.1 sensory box histidine kinase/response regulator [Legionella quinlivanii]
MIRDLNWFQEGPLPADTIYGSYDPKLVVLSYIIAVLASYVALDFAGRLRAEKNSRDKIYWLLGGAFAMGAGIWSMHFIGMLSFIMPMAMGYDVFWTVFSLLLAIAVSFFALFILRSDNHSVSNLIAGGIVIGLGIASMHYAGMEGMRVHVQIHYIITTFFLSILIAILASEAALWLALESNRGSSRKQFYTKMLSALVMGIAICGMHYTGMAAAVFTPLAAHGPHIETVNQDLLAFFVAGITGLIISLALMVSTYYKQMLKVVQNEREFVDAILNNLDDGIIACNTSGIITVYNKALKKNYQHSSQVAGLKLSDYLHFESLDNQRINDNQSPLIRALRGEKIHGMELLIQFNNGERRNVIVDGQAIKSTDDSTMGAVIAIHDITDLKETEKMKREFVSVVSHELRTPLTSIRGALGLLLGGAVGSFSEKAQRLLDIANKNCERLLLLINDILDMEKIQAGKMDFKITKINLSNLIMDSIQAIKMYGEKYNVSVRFEKSLPDIVVQVDPDRLMQVIANLLSNAIKFSPSGSEVTISMKLQGNQVRVIITDCGSGIPPEFQPRIFQQFSQADSSSTRGKGGTGLGLSISKAIIDKMGGHINFTSQPGVGSQFYFDLNTSAETQEQTTPQIINPNRDRFLICEDDPDQSKFLGLLMESAGFAVDIVDSVAEAKKCLNTTKYKAILLDLILPDQDGISFIRELRNSEKTRELPVIVLSVIAETGHSIINGDAILVIDWLDKPINFDKLLLSIGKIKEKNKDRVPLILHVEDDIDMQKVVRTVLETEANLTSVSTLHEAKEVLEKQQFDLIILDLLLPDGSGTQLLPVLAEKKFPVIVYSNTELDQEYSKYVVDALVKAKTTNDDLLNKIRHLFNEQEGGHYA